MIFNLLINQYIPNTYEFLFILYKYIYFKFFKPKKLFEKYNLLNFYSIFYLCSKLIIFLKLYFFLYIFTFLKKKLNNNIIKFIIFNYYIIYIYLLRIFL